MSASGRDSNSHWRVHLCFLTAIALFLTGCGDDGVSDLTFECTNCEFWTKLSDDRAAFPAYFPSQSDSGRTVAFSSDRGNDLNIENIWVLVRSRGDEEDRYYQITDALEDEFDPAWSPDGTKIAFTRSVSGRFDIFVKDVADLANPGDEVRITSETPIPNDTLSLPFRPTGAVWIDGDEILFSNGIDIFIVKLGAGDTPEALRKVIDDPSDYVLSNVSDFVENQATGIRLGGEGTEQIYFVSDSRVALGAIRVQAVNVDVEGGEEVNAEIYLEGVPSRVETPNVVGGRPVGTYVVGARVTDLEATQTFCDTLITDIVNVFENDTADVDLEFSENRGVIRLLTPSLNSFLFYDGRPLPPIDSDTTLLSCVFPNVDHVIKIESIEIVNLDSITGEVVGLMDSTCVRVAQRETLTVRLNVDDRASTGMSDDSCSAFGKGLPEDDLWKNMNVQQGEPILWQYDGDTGSYTALLAGQDLYPSYPAISPDGTKLAVVLNFELLGVLDFEQQQAYEIRLPGEAGINICLRDIAYPAWSPDGEKILVALSPCTDQPSSDNNATEYNVWEVDWARAAVPR